MFNFTPVNTNFIKGDYAAHVIAFEAATHCYGILSHRDTDGTCYYNQGNLAGKGASVRLFCPDAIVFININGISSYRIEEDQFILNQA